MFKNNILLLKYLITKIRRVHHEYETQNFYQNQTHVLAQCHCFYVYINKGKKKI